MADPNWTYDEAAHAMQSGVAAEMNINPWATDPKRLRVGVNSAHASQAGLADLLISAGVITEAQYLEAMRVWMIKEVERYEKLLSAHYGTEVKLA